jgi:tetratricopeptide (TPR) repeat protein
MSELLRICILAAGTAGFLSLSSAGQEMSKPAVASSSSMAERGINLATKGRCREALPVLKKAAAQPIDSRDLKHDVLTSTARCAMALEQTEAVVKALLDLNRAFPDDPETLYVATHFYSELASRASQELAAKAPTSAQAQQLEAEAFESHGEWDKAATEYRTILEQHPQQHGIHYRLGRVYLAETPPDVEKAKTEFEQELKVDPGNASAEFMLGETARQAGQWDEAIVRFSKAADLDVSFDEAYLALGMSLNSAGKFSDAVAPLETYVKRQPGDAAGHYQLGTAYARTGRKQDATKEMNLQREMAAKSPRQPSQP